MKKCEFCEHHDYTENLEEVCTKHLMYLGEIEHDFPCKEFRADRKFGIVGLAVSALFAFRLLMVSLIS